MLLSKSWGVIKSPLLSVELLAWRLWSLVLNSSLSYGHLLVLPRFRLWQRCCGKKMRSLEARAGQGEPKPGHRLSAAHQVWGLAPAWGGRERWSLGQGVGVCRGLPLWDLPGLRHGGH